MHDGHQYLAHLLHGNPISRWTPVQHLVGQKREIQKRNPPICQGAAERHRVNLLAVKQTTVVYIKRVL